MKRAVLTLLVIIGIVCGGIYFYLGSFIPDYSDEFFVPGLQDKVVIERNRFAVPSITAKSDEDLYFAWGYVNAQDRMFQMEFTRRVAQGRISEFAGETAYEKDFFLKAMGFYDIAGKETRNMDPMFKRFLQRYVDGVNYFLNHNSTPIYMKLLGIKKEEWTLADPLAVAMMLNWSLAYNMKHELLYYRMEQKIGKSGVKELLKLIPPQTPTTIDDKVSPDYPSGLLSAHLKELDWLLGCNSASNGWVVGPQHSACKGSLFSSDMQVHQSKLPSDFYLIHLKSGDFQAAGAQITGLPLIMAGYSQKFAWGLTNNGADTVDLFKETIDWQTKTYQFQGKAYPLDSKKITINIKDNAPVEKTVYYVGRKPLLNEVFPDLTFDVSLDWAGFDGADIEGFFLLNHALDNSQFLKGAQKIRVSPQNMLYTDDQGNIGYRVIGSLPNRTVGTGNFIQDGEQVKHNWKGNIPDSSYPQVVNPDRGFIVSANNKMKKVLKYDFNGTYAPGYRYENIVRMLKHQKNMDVDTFKKMQTDTYTILSEKIKKIIKQYVAPGSPREQEAFDLVMNWDGYNRKKDAAPSIYNTFYVRLFSHILEDELGEDLAGEYIVSRYISQERLFRLLDENSRFIDDVSTPEEEPLHQIATAAFRDTVERLARLFDTDDPAAWQWGQIHQIKFDHVLGKSDLLRPLVNYGPFPFEGDSETNNRARFYEAKPPFIANLASAPRIIVKFDPEPKGYMMLITGENEYFLSQHNTDMTDAWLNHEFFCLEEETKIYKTVMKAN